jgi:anhydro-N-acetylmuramic acid kinase
VSATDVDLGHLLASAAEAVADYARQAIDLVACHGQTISHTPHRRATLQIGEAAVIAARMGVPVISDFRAADMAVGGHGAPLVPYVDWCLLTHPTKTRAIQNVGGIGNVTYLPAGAAPEQVIGFDTGPGNMLIDRAAAEWTSKAFDEDGRLAAQGRVEQRLLAWLMEHPFLKRKPPRSAGREEFGEAYWQEIRTRAAGIGAADVTATLTHFTAETIADSYSRYFPRMPDDVIVGGGGARNPMLMKMLRERLAPIPALVHEDVGMNGDAKEALAFAILANETMLGHPSNLPSVTGASRPVLLGKITLP